MKQIIVESSFGSIWRELMEGITCYARDRRRPWHLNCVTTPELPDVLKLHPDGVICLLPQSQRKLVRLLAASRLPAVNLLRDIHPAIPTVMSDNELIGERAADYLRGRGYRHFAFVGVNRFWSQQRESGFRRRLATAGQTVLSCPLPLTVEGLRLDRTSRLYRGVQRWLCDLPQPVALFAGADFVGRTLIEICSYIRLAVPEQVAILGVDNDPSICGLTSVPMSSIPQNMRRIGFEAALLLDRMIQQKKRRRSLLKIPPAEVVVRRSTDFIAVENPYVAAALRHIRTTDVSHLDMKSLLREVGRSRQWLDRKFREVMGITPAQEICRQKLVCARSLLLETHLTVQSIAIRSGFTQGENLSRFFKEHIGLSPRDFRQKHGFVDERG